MCVCVSYCCMLITAYSFACTFGFLHTQIHSHTLLMHYMHDNSQICILFSCTHSHLHVLPSLPCPTHPSLNTTIGKGGVFKSLGDMGAVVTNLALGTTRMMGARLGGSGSGSSPKKKAGTSDKEDTLVMDTKLNIIEILEVSESSLWNC